MDTDITEMRDFEADRVDGVLAGANGVPFLVVKAMDGMSDLISTDDDSGTPGSPSWEAADAQNLREAATALAALRDKITLAADRESDELEAGVEDSYSDVWDLQDALCALDAALGIVARLSFTEAQESEVTKSLDSIRTTIDRLGGSNNTAVEADMTEAEITELVEKAVAEALAAVEPADETEAVEEVAPEAVAGDVAKADESETPSDVAEPAADAGVAKSEVEEVAPEAPAEAEVAKADEAEAAAETEAPVAKAEEAPAVPTAEVFKSVVAEVLAELFGDPLNELKERLDAVEKSPAPGGPLLNGATGTIAPRDPQAVADDREQTRKAIDAEPDPAKRAVMARQGGIADLTSMYSGAVRPLPIS